MIRCRRVAARLDAFVDGELGDKDRRMVEQHLAACESCRARHHELTRQVELIESLPRVAPSAHLRRSIITTLPQRPARRRARPRAPVWRLAWAGTAVVALAAIVAAVVLLTAPAPDEKRIAPAPQKRQVVAEKTPAPSPVDAGPQEKAPGPETPDQPRKRPAPAPKPEPAEPDEAPEMLAQDYRDQAQEHEREGELYDALVAYEQADEADDREASVDVARVYEKMGYTADAVDHYADLAFASLDWTTLTNNGG